MNNRERIQKRIERDKARRLSKRTAFNEHHDSYQEVFDFERLWEAGKKCANGVRWKASVQRWEASLLTNVSNLYNDLQTKRFQKHSGNFYCFDLFERGHLRHIRSLKIYERTAQRALCDNALVPALEQSFIYDNGATMKGRGITFAEKRLTKHIRQFINSVGIDAALRDGYVVQFDFHHYFDNADHATLFRIVDSYFKDTELVSTIRKFISDFGDVGLGLGSQISQVLALTLANDLDHVIKDKAREKWYERYMDDGVVICKTKADAIRVMNLIKDVCRDLNIVVNEKKTRIIKFSRGFKFLKVIYRVTDTGRIYRKTNHAGIKRQRQKLRSFRKKLDRGEIDLEHIEMSVESFITHCERADSFHTRLNMVNRFHRMFPESKAFYRSKYDATAVIDKAVAFVKKWRETHKNPDCLRSRRRMKKAYKIYLEKEGVKDNGTLQISFRRCSC